MAVPEAICQSGVRWKFGILTVYLQCSAVLDPRVWHHGILHLAAELASMHFATGVKEQRGQGPIFRCHLQFSNKNEPPGHTLSVGKSQTSWKEKELDFTSWWVSIWNLSSIHHDTDGAGKEPKAKQVKLWLWPEKRGALATVAPNSTDNGRKYKSKMTARERACERLLLFPEQVNSVWRWCLCRLSTFMVFLDLPGMISS